MKSLVKTNRVSTPSFSKYFDNFFMNDFPSGPKQQFRLPSVNIKENEDAYEIEVSAPGLKKEHFNISIDEEVMTISYTDPKKDTETGDRYTRREFTKSSFLRRFTLPETIEDGKVDAKYNDGILSVTLPKKEEAKPKPAIDVKVK